MNSEVVPTFRLSRSKTFYGFFDEKATDDELKYYLFRSMSNEYRISFFELYRWYINVLHKRLPKIPTDIIVFEIMHYMGIPVLKNMKITYTLVPSQIKKTVSIIKGHKM